MTDASPAPALAGLEPMGWASTFRCECGCWYAVEPVKDANGETVVQVTRMAQPPCRAQGVCR